MDWSQIAHPAAAPFGVCEQRVRVCSHASQHRHTRSPCTCAGRQFTADAVHIAAGYVGVSGGAASGGSAGGGRCRGPRARLRSRVAAPAGPPAGRAARHARRSGPCHRRAAPCKAARVRSAGAATAPCPLWPNPRPFGQCEMPLCVDRAHERLLVG